MQPVYLIDASIYIFRAYFSLPDSITDQQGNPVNAITGYADFLHRFLRQTRATHVGVAFDRSLTSSFRNRIYPDYKSNRELPPEDLAAQLRCCETLTRHLGIATFASKIYEADDLIGSLANIMQKKKRVIHIVSSDKDLTQLIQGRDILWDFARDIRYNATAIRKRFGVRPEQIIDYLALTGDPVDCIPGTPGIGAKTAAALLQRYKDIDTIYKNLDKLGNIKIRGAARIQQALKDNVKQLKVSRRLARIVTNVPIASVAKRLKRKRPDRSRLAVLFNELNFSDRRLQKFLRLA